MGAPHNFAEWRVFEVGEAGTALAGREEQVPKSGGPGHWFQFFDDGDGLPAVGTLAVLVITPLIGVDMLVHERGEALPEFLSSG